VVGRPKYGSNSICRCRRTHAKASSLSATPRRARPCEWPRLRSAVYRARYLGSRWAATVGRAAERRISADCKVGSIAPAHENNVRAAQGTTSRNRARRSTNKGKEGPQVIVMRSFAIAPEQRAASRVINNRHSTYILINIKVPGLETGGRFHFVRYADGSVIMRWGACPRIQWHTRLRLEEGARDGSNRLGWLISLPMAYLPLRRSDVIFMGEKPVRGVDPRVFFGTLPPPLIDRLTANLDVRQRRVRSRLLPPAVSPVRT
jgi:hypothetical protein